MRQDQALRRRRIKTPGRGGYTLVEVLLATLIACVMVTTVFSVSLTTRRDTSHNDRRLVADQIARAVTARLANYVSGCCNSSGCDGNGSPPNPPPCTLPGPNTNNLAHRWSFSEPGEQICDSCGGALYACGNCYAFQLGDHKITGTGIIPDYLGNPPYNAYVEYAVGTFSATEAPNLDPADGGEPVTVHWTEPNDK